MRWDDEALMAYVHGELDPTESKRIEAAMAADPDLARRVRAFRNARRALITAYESVARQPIPEHWTQLLDTLEEGEGPDGFSIFQRPRGKPH